MLGFNTGPNYYKGYYHLFHQYNQSMPLWGPNMSWVYAVSKHLIHWLYLEIVLELDQWYDAMGVWLGSNTQPQWCPFHYLHKFAISNSCHHCSNFFCDCFVEIALLRNRGF